MARPDQEKRWLCSKLDSQEAQQRHGSGGDGCGNSARLGKFGCNDASSFRASQLYRVRVWELFWRSRCLVFSVKLGRLANALWTLVWVRGLELALSTR